MANPRDSVILSVEALLALEEELNQPPVHVMAGDWLFHQGEESDSAYVVESGRLEIVDEAGGNRRLNVVTSGTVVGELALLSGHPRAAGIRALRDSTLTVFSRPAFERLISDKPGFGLSLARSLARALRSSATAAPDLPQPPGTIGVFGSSAAPVGAVASELAALLAERGGARVFVPPGGEPHSWGAALDEAEQEHGHVVLPAAADAPAQWHDFCLRQSDRLLVLAAGAPPGEVEPRLLGCDLVLDAHTPATQWIERYAPSRTHLAGDLGRLARHLDGRALGVVLSGGGARGLAHIGVLAELESSGLVIDRVGGCSMGALIAALYAQGRRPAEIAAACRAELVGRRPFGDYTLPRQSLIRAQRAKDMLQRLLGEARIETLPRSYYCVTADLVTADVVVHRDGLVRDAVLASMSVPGVMPPRRAGGRLLVDGGVLANLPLRPMSERGDGPVVAVDAMGRRLTVEDERAPTAAPGILEILARATVLGSWRQARALAELATMTIRPALPEMGLLDFARMDVAIDAGRRAAAAALEDGGLDALTLI